jgi:hypothetical protein
VTIAGKNEGRIELHRSDIGFGRVVVDDSGVTRKGLFRSKHLRFSEIESYRLSLTLRGITGDTGYLVAGPLAWIADYGAAREGRHRLRFGIELVGADTTLDFNWRFRAVHTAIAAVLGRMHERITARARQQLEETSVARFGGLALAEHGIQWKRHDPIPREAIECVQIFDSTDVTLRIMQKDRTLPYCSPELDDVPDLMSALAIAGELGYRIEGRHLLRSIQP